MFQHTAARRRLPAKKILELLNQAFQHTAARRRLLSLFKSGDVDFYVSTHSRPKAAATSKTTISKGIIVSTHSRPKAAATSNNIKYSCSKCFNTQPPEGGCPLGANFNKSPRSFNTQPPEGGCTACGCGCDIPTICFNTQPPEGGCQPRKFLSF